MIESKCSKCDKSYEEYAQTLAVFERPIRFYCTVCKTYTLPTYVISESEFKCFERAYKEVLKFKDLSKEFKEKFGEDSEEFQFYKQIIGK